MPIYTYLCAECGPFTELAPMSESALPAFCPVCGEAAPRTMSATAPPTGGDTPKYHSPPRSEDDGFRREWDSIFKDEYK